MRIGWLAASLVLVGLGSASRGDITGAVTLNGNAPNMNQIKAIQAIPGCAKVNKGPVFEETVVVGPNNELQNIVVSIETPPGQVLNGRAPAASTLDQVGCVYVPHVVAVMKGAPLTVKSADPFLHNVHTMAVINPATNFGMPTVGQKPIQFPQVEDIRVKCDVHPWMTGWICVMDNPYYAVTDADGKYTIDTKGLPDGAYTLVAWQEKYKAIKQQVKVVNGKVKADFVYNAPGANGNGAAPAPAPAPANPKAAAPAAREVTFASLLKESGQEPEGSCCGHPAGEATTRDTKAAATTTKAK